MGFNDAIAGRLPLVRVVEWLESIDPLAARYARENGYDQASDIDQLFTWRDTPQGQTFWSNLSEKFENDHPDTGSADEYDEEDFEIER